MKTAKYKRSFTVSLREETYQRIKDVSDVRGVSMGEVIRETLEKEDAYGEQEKNLADQKFSM